MFMKDLSCKGFLGVDYFQLAAYAARFFKCV